VFLLTNYWISRPIKSDKRDCQSLRDAWLWDVERIIEGNYSKSKGSRGCSSDSGARIWLRVGWKVCVMCRVMRCKWTHVTYSYASTNLGRPLGLKVEACRISRQSAHEGGKVVSPAHRSPSPSRKYPCYSFILGLLRYISPLNMVQNVPSTRRRSLHVIGADVCVRGPYDFEQQQRM
jgi:hypothetical protein